MAILGETEPLENFYCTRYIQGDPKHEEMLDRYISTTDIKNNNSRKSIRVNMYNGVDGEMFLAINKNTEEIDAMTSCILYEEDGIRSAKSWHRLHIKNNCPTTILDYYFEEATYKWCYENNIRRLWVTFNESTPRTGCWAAARMGERRNKFIHNYFSGQYGHEIRVGWRPHNKLVYERNTWQYVIYYSPDNKFFLKRDEKELDDEMKNVFKRNFEHATYNWD